MTSPDDPSSTKRHAPYHADPPGQPTAFLIVLQGATAGQVFKLDRPVCVIGRAENADGPLADLGVSGTHAVVRVASGGAVSIQDLRSTNGTRVNDEPVDGTQNLEDGDRISMGATTILKFTFDDELKDSLQQRLADVGRIDALTGAYREKYFKEFLRSEFSYARRHLSALSVVVISIDHFQELLARHGDALADQILVEFSTRARVVLQKQHLFARLGHRTFGLLCRALPCAEACVLSDEIRLAMAAAPVDVHGVRVGVTISVGVASLPFRGINSATELLRLADMAVYDAKVTHTYDLFRE